jgi:hypothetical protein
MTHRISFPFIFKLYWVSIPGTRIVPDYKNPGQKKNTLPFVYRLGLSSCMVPQLSWAFASMSGYCNFLIGEIRGNLAAFTLQFYELSGQSWKINSRVGLRETTFNGFSIDLATSKVCHCWSAWHCLYWPPFSLCSLSKYSWGQSEYTCLVQINSVKSLGLTVEDASHLYSYCVVCSYVSNQESGTRAFSLSSATVIRQLRVPLLMRFPLPP